MVPYEGQVRFGGVYKPRPERIANIFNGQRAFDDYFDFNTSQPTCRNFKFSKEKHQELCNKLIDEFFINNEGVEMKPRLYYRNTRDFKLSILIKE